MIIKKLTIYNMFAYSGKHIIDLSTYAEKNTVLIFGKNGRGKTSFYE